MKILLRNAHIYDIRSKHHDTKRDVLIEQGHITKIAKRITPPAKTRIITSPGLSISPGWLDIGTFNGEPGYEYREDLDSLRQAAVAGGYAALAPFPTGHPTIDNKGQLHYLRSQAQDHIVDIYPIAAISKNREGKELSELLDMAAAGAAAFSDGNASSDDEDVLIKALLYLKSCDGLVIQSASSQSPSGHVNEGEISVKMGLEGMPIHLEKSRVQTLVRAAEYAKSKMLICNISTSEALAEIRKSSQLATLDSAIPFMNLIYDENDVIDFNLSLKVNPPLRSTRDKKALVKAINSGQVNIITSNHTPLSKEEKDQPFGMSAFGAATLELVFSALVSKTDIPLDRLVHCLSIGPREALSVACPKVAVGHEACLTLFDPSVDTAVASPKSKGTNSLVADTRFKGQIIGLINGEDHTL